MIKRSKGIKILVAFVIFLFIPSVLAPITTYGRTLEEIQAEINNQQSALSGVTSQLKDAESKLAGIKGSLSSAQGEIPQLEGQIKEIEATIELNKLQIQQKEESKKLKELEQEEREMRQKRALRDGYVSWRSEYDRLDYYFGHTGLHPVKNELYQTKVMHLEENTIIELAGDVKALGDELSTLNTETTNLAFQNEELVSRKKELEARVVALRAAASSTGTAIAGLKAESGRLQSTIQQLSSEQKALEDYEAWILGQNPNAGGSTTLIPGEMYFTGRGRELYQGHGVGLSQFGAYGAAENGWSAASILTFYYQNTRIESRPGTISVSGYGTMDVNTYAAGQGEVPTKACGSAEQAAARPDKYVVNNPSTVWDCWPEEAIKAQIIAFRSYGLHYVQTYGGSICTSTSCQVYNGSQNSWWAADETRDQVVVSSGYSDNNRIIEALYSSDNHNGWGTANNDTRFSGYSGDGTAISYLRAVNDSAFTHHFLYTDWTWRTNSYTYADFDSLLNYAVNDGGISSGSRSYVAQVRAAIGNIVGITFERDPSGRVKKVWFTGTTGGSASMAGWFFKTIWNSWVYGAQPSGQVDYIYSATFYLLQAS